jgi:methylmalonyl-CoA/ethylmalonyl-CoA epimerase
MNQPAIGTNIITQIGLVVHDINQSIDAYVTILGLPRPNVVITDGYELAKTSYRGQPSPPRQNLHFSIWARCKLS